MPSSRPEGWLGRSGCPGGGKANGGGVRNLPLGGCGSGDPGKAEKYNSLKCRKAAELASSCSQRSQRGWRNPKAILESREMKIRERKAW